MGEDLDSLEFDELRGLEQNVDTALKEVRHRKARTNPNLFVQLLHIARSIPSAKLMSSLQISAYFMRLGRSLFMCFLIFFCECFFSSRSVRVLFF